ncbi:MAG: YbhN family protein [Acidimicrobiia bacterium]
MVIVIAIGAVRSWPLITDALTHIAALERRTLLIVAGAWLSLVVVRGVVHRATHPALRLSHGILFDQVNLAASNSLPGGSIIGIAARFRIARALGLSAEASGLTVAASGQAFALGRWVLALTVALGFVLAGHGTNADVIVCLAALGAFGVAALLWRLVTGDGPITQALLTVIGSVHRWVALRWVRARRFHLEKSLDRVQRGVGKIVRERGLTLLMAGVLSSLVSASIVVVLASELGQGTSPATWDILRAYLLARVATSFVPTPGNVGALDGALIAGLVATGLDPSVAIAVVLLYRAVTFVAPIGMGTAAWLVWRRRSAPPQAEPEGRAPAGPMAPGVGLEPTTL